jgi:hypothetical protein
MGIGETVREVGAPAGSMGVEKPVRRNRLDRRLAGVLSNGNPGPKQFIFDTQQVRDDAFLGLGRRLAGIGGLSGQQGKDEGISGHDRSPGLE